MLKGKFIVNRVHEIKNENGNYAFVDLVSPEKLGDKFTVIASAKNVDYLKLEVNKSYNFDISLSTKTLMVQNSNTGFIKPQNVLGAFINSYSI